MKRLTRVQRQEFDKYKYYIRSVQSPKEDVRFFNHIYREINRKSARILREDFCGTFLICCEWVKLHSRNAAIGVDFSREPLFYGRKNHLSQLTGSQQKRVTLKESNVLNFRSIKSDIVVAVNFSFYVFKERQFLKKYFRSVFLSLKPQGLFIVDCFGGPECQSPNEEEREYKDFSYFWDQMSFDAITCHAQFQIHFKRKGERKRKNVFQYDWRMWSIPELKDIMEEVGFREVFVYWEGTDKKGEGTGEYKRQEGTSENCSTWVAYLVGKV